MQIVPCRSRRSLSCRIASSASPSSSLCSSGGLRGRALHRASSSTPRRRRARRRAGRPRRGREAVVELFERVSPSVVHVYAQPDPRRLAETTGASRRAGRTGERRRQRRAVGHRLPVGRGRARGHEQPRRRGRARGPDPPRLRRNRPGGRWSERRRTTTSPCCASGAPDGRRPPIPVGTSADLKVGQSAFAIGNPFGLDQTLTTGVISALQRRLPTSEGREIADVIQTDAAINPGNSGGPLLDSAGRLIGVNTAIYSPSGAYAGIGFAIPVDVVNRVVPQLIRTGRMPNPGIGIIAGQEAIARAARDRRSRGRARRCPARRPSAPVCGASIPGRARSATSSSASTASPCGGCRISRPSWKGRESAAGRADRGARGPHHDGSRDRCRRRATSPALSAPGARRGPAA